MRPHVNAAADVEAMIYEHLAADSALVGLMGSRGGAPIFLYPTSDVASLLRPFLHITLDGAGSLGPGKFDRATWAIRINDEQAIGMFRLMRIVERVKARFDRATWDWPTLSSAHPAGSEWAGMSGPLADEAWATTVVVARIVIFQ